jgi:hypothetical protein
MTVITLFLIGAAITSVMSSLTVLVLRPHLAKLLGELCGSAARAAFWLAAFCLSIFLFGILAGTVQLGYPEGSNAPAPQLFFGLVTQLRACVLGLLLSVIATAWLLLGMVRRYEQGGTPPPRPGRPAGDGRLAPAAQAA